MSSEVCLDVPTKQSGEFVSKLRLGCGVHSPATRVIEDVRRRLYIEDVRNKALVQRGGHNADDGLNVWKAMRPSELRHDTSGNYSRLLCR